MLTKTYEFYSGSQPLLGVKKGYFPSFYNLLFDITLPGTYTLSRTTSPTNGLILTDPSGISTFKAVKDGSAPHYIIGMVQGGGGGGAGRTNLESGSGGGGGGFACGIIPCDTSLTIVVGKGGRGG